MGRQRRGGLVAVTVQGRGLVGFSATAAAWGVFA
jgi:hypothetical protein